MRGINMKRIDISTKKYPNTFTFVDDEDYDWLMGWNWYAWKPKNIIYAVRSFASKYERGMVLMHHQIMNTPPKMETDHENRDGLYNIRSNLRICTTSQNSYNTCKYKNNLSGYKGVSWCKFTKKWRAQIRYDGKSKHIGRYFCLIKAAKAYDAESLNRHGEFAYTNL